MQEHQDSFDYITNHTGAPITTLQNIFGIFQTLTAEKNMNLTLPEWAESVYTEEITNLAIKQCQLENSNEILKKLNGGKPFFNFNTLAAGYAYSKFTLVS